MPTIHGHNVEIYHKPDFIGDVVITVQETTTDNSPDGRVTVVVAFEDLRTLVIAYMKQQMVNNISEMTESEFLHWNIFS
jgi:hypothetical protein